MPRRRRRPRGWAHYAAPTAFLVGATIAIVLVASALRGGSADERAGTTAVATSPSSTRPKAKTTTGPNGRRYYTVVAGDTFGAIAAKTGVPVKRLQRLNPGVSSTSLHIGQKLRVA